jgi:hypothetical protein
MKNKIDLNFRLKSLKGEEIQGEVGEANKVVAEALYHSGSDSLKFASWAIDLYAGKVIELDDTDRDVLKAFVETYSKVEHRGMYSMSLMGVGNRAQIVDAIKKGEG